MKKNPAPPRIRNLMPDGFLGILAGRTGCTSMPDLSQIVLRERTKSKYWPAVETLAAETNPHGFATWKATQPTDQPATTTALAA